MEASPLGTSRKDLSSDRVTREKWAHKIEFVLSGIGFAVGLGNIWRFPYLCYKNGGGAFLIPYTICLVTGGIPIFFLEVGLGQYMSEGGITAWNICPIFRGIGIGTTIICFVLNVYYIVILAWALHYLWNSLSAELPWASCGNPWNTPRCFKPLPTTLTSRSNATTSSSLRVDPVVEYWEKKVLGVSSGIEEVGTIQTELAVSLFLVWLAVYFCVWKGIKTSGKVVYFTAVFPYFMMTALLIRGITLDGAKEGIEFYLKPNFSKLLESQVWIDAGTQIFFSYAIALGCMTALGSYNTFHNNFIKDCLFISVVNSCTSLYSGLAVFSVLGFMAKEQGVSIEVVAESGPGLVFITYPKALTEMPFAPVWAALFFFMILLMGLDSQFVGVEGFVTAVVDLYPNYLRRSGVRKVFIALVSFLSYLIGLTMVTNGGIYVFQVFDYYGASGMVLLWFCFFESIVIAYFYGIDKFYNNITEMVGYRLHAWFRYCWLFFTPLCTMGILIFSTVQATPLTYNRRYKYPNWALRIGWTLALVPMAAIPSYFIFYLLTRPGNLREVPINIFYIPVTQRSGRLPLSRSSRLRQN